jgi:hypothetical protein
VLGRLVLGYAVALPLIVGLLAGAVGDPRTYTISVTMESSVPGHVQVFFDSGAGFREVESSNAWFETAPGAHEYRLRLPAGRYRTFRIDPGTLPGRYAIERVTVLAPDGSIHADIPLTALAPAYQVTVVEKSDRRLVVTTPPGTSDPQLLYSPPVPVVIPRLVFTFRGLRTSALVGLVWVAAVALVWLIGRIMGRPGSWLDRMLIAARTVWAARPAAAVAVTAVVATMLSTYPVLFGRSFVAPTNGYLRLFYESPPFAPGSDDERIEETRGSDVAATVYAFMPYSRLQREALSQGEVPLWNRYNAAGRPLWGQGQTFLLDPLHWLTIVTPDLTLGWDLKFIAHRFVFALGIGVAALLATGATVPAVIAATTAPFVSVYLFRLNHPAAFTLSYAPWALAGWFLLARASSRRELSGAAALMAVSMSFVLLSSPPKEAAVMLLGLATAGVLAVLLAPGAWVDRRQRIVAALVGGVALGLLTAPHWLIFLDTLRLSMTSYDRPYAILARREHALGLFLTPLVPGLLRPGLNVLVLVLLIAAATSPWRLLRSPAVFSCALAGFALVGVAFGAVPVSWLLRIPFLGNIGHIDDVFVTASVPLLLIVAAWGASVLVACGYLRRIAVSTSTALIGVWLVKQVVWLTKPGGFEPFAVALILVPAVAFPWVLRQACAGRPHRAVDAAAIATVAVLLFPVGLHLNSSLPLLEHLLIQPRPRTAVDGAPPAALALRAASSEPQRVVGVDWWLFSGSQGLYGLEGIGGPDALETATYEELVNAGGITRYWLWLTTVPGQDLDRLGPLLDLLNVGFLVAGAEDAPPGFVDVPVVPSDRARIGRRETVWPRAFFADGVTSYGDVQDFLRQAGTAGRPIAAVQSSDREAVEATRAFTTPSGATIPARDYTLTVNTSRFTVVAPGAGLAVLGETFLPGEFHATLNGAPVPYFRVNHAFKGVVIPSAGEWTVEFRHQPRRWMLSLFMGGAGLLTVASLVAGAVTPARSRRINATEATSASPRRI